MSLVSIRDVRKSFGPNEVLKGVSLEVAKGDVVAIIGRSGSGKSTLLRCINGLETYQSGADHRRRHRGRRHHHQSARAAPPCRHGVPAVQPVSASDGGRERDAGADRGQQGVGARRRAPPRPRCWRRSGCPRRWTPIRTSSPAASSSASRSRVRWRCGPRYCCATKSPRRSIPNWSTRCCAWSSNWRAKGMTLILVTHEMRFARDVGTKLVFMHHGKVHEEGVPKEVFAAPRTPELQQFVGTVG